MRTQLLTVLLALGLSANALAEPNWVNWIGPNKFYDSNSFKVDGSLIKFRTIENVKVSEYNPKPSSLFWEQEINCLTKKWRILEVGQYSEPFFKGVLMNKSRWGDEWLDIGTGEGFAEHARKFCFNIGL